MRWPQWPFPKKKLLRLECLAPLLITSLSTIEHLPSASSSANYLTNSSELTSRERLDWYRLCFVWQRFAPSSCYQIAPGPSTRVAGCATLFSCPAGTAAVVVHSSSLACQCADCNWSSLVPVTSRAESVRFPANTHHPEPILYRSIVLYSSSNHPERQSVEPVQIRTRPFLLEALRMDARSRERSSSSHYAARSSEDHDTRPTQTISVSCRETSTGTQVAIQPSLQATLYLYARKILIQTAILEARICSIS